MRWLLSIALVVLAGCASRPVAKFPPIPPRGPALAAADTSAAAEARAASTLPDTLRGCQWTWDGLPGEEVTFEVWASVDLVQWQLATNTTARIALFPQKQMEFYRVRSRDALGSVSDWAPVAK